ncbi:hypothetical protein [Amycolatopsis regifaucium]|uniref:Uncharacterized protein n=1 Tax=Amycolatopsis regifaucium TaxID=546365 RepID=A0A154MTU4_9PSEU|nr:hypothetical protein [Amycolatopsis regifaucium]KZB87530.1 hypothetical protein AVL48_23195 [Amycolatopsis regifaucium]OKA08363.1 hypothetical protein ATP06_0213955 [Amycolatopsis regifaucium]SFI08387.1 hypothetical protein SAMN04489731_108112 [Amycolatopsis regifaucium]
MNTRVLRTELRRSIAPWATLAILVVAFGFLVSFSGPWSKGPLAWDEHWTLAAEWSRFLLVFLWPIAIGAGVIQGMRDSRSGMVELLTTTPRPGWHRAAKLAAALGGLLVLGYLLIFAVGAVQVLFSGAFFTFGWLPIVGVGVLAMLAGAWIGLGIGRLLPHPLTAPAVAVAALVVVIVFQVVPSAGSAFEGALPLRLVLLSPAMDVFKDPFLTTSGRMNLGQAVWLTGLAVTGFLFLATRSKRTKALAVVPALVAAAIAIPVLPGTTAEAKVVDPLATAKVCDGPVCVTRMHEAELARIAGPGKEALRLLSTLPDAPVKIVQLDRRLEPDEVPPRAADTIYADLMDWPLRVAIEPRDVTRVLVGGAGTPSCYSSRGYDKSFLDEIVARTIAASWLLGEWKLVNGESAWLSEQSEGEVAGKWEAFRALPPDVQRARIIAQRQAGLTCQGKQLDILLGGA